MAEIRGLAYASGDETLIHLVSDPDEAFAETKDGNTVRLNFQSCPAPEEFQKPEFILAYWKNNELKQRYTEDDLARDDKGNLVHPSTSDLHWSLAEMMHGKPREMLNKDTERDGSGKAGNFSCLPKDVGVLTNNGVIPILDVNKDSHLLWDGLEWVSHEGLISKGKQYVVEYQGLRATVDHGVWLEDGREVFFGEAILRGLNLARTATASGQAEVAGFEGASRSEKEHQGDSACVNKMRELRQGVTQVAASPGARAWYRLCVQEAEGLCEIQAIETLQCHETALRALDACRSLQLQGARDQCGIRKQGALYQLGHEKVAWGEFPGFGIRSYKQRWKLFAKQFAVSGQGDQSAKQTKEPSAPASRYGKKISGEISGSSIIGSGAQEPAVCGHGSGHTGKELGELCCGGSDKSQNREFQSDGCCSVFEESPAGRLLYQSAQKVDLAGDVRGRYPGKMEHIPYQPASRQPDKHSAEDDLRAQLGVFGTDRVPDVEKREDRGGNCKGAGAEKVETQCGRLGKGVYGREPGFVGVCIPCVYDVQQRDVAGGDEIPLGQAGYRGRPKEELIRLLREAGYAMTLEPVYDLINAGPRHRFTANGVLVSNTAYGASETSLERKIEADTGHKPEEGTGALIIEALWKRQPKAMAYLEELQEYPKTHDYLQLQSGRRRHFLGANRNARMRNRDWEQLMSSQGRECRNIVFQESVAATSAKACNWLMEEYRQRGMKAYVMVCLYDAICTMCPVEERFLVKDLHQEFMCDKNVWVYHERELRYPIDTEYVFKWSTSLDKKSEEYKLLYTQQ